MRTHHHHIAIHNTYSGHLCCFLTIEEEANSSIDLYLIYLLLVFISSPTECTRFKNEDSRVRNCACCCVGVFLGEAQDQHHHHHHHHSHGGGKYKIKKYMAMLRYNSVPVTLGPQSYRLIRTFRKSVYYLGLLCGKWMR